MDFYAKNFALIKKSQINQSKTTLSQNGIGTNGLSSLYPRFDETGICDIPSIVSPPQLFGL